MASTEPAVGASLAQGSQNPAIQTEVSEPRPLTQDPDGNMQQTTPVIRHSSPTSPAKVLVTLLSFVVVLIPSIYLGSNSIPAPNIFREYGIVGNVTKAFVSQSPNGFFTLPLGVFLRGAIRLNVESQSQSASLGALEAAQKLIEVSNSSPKQLEGLNVLLELLRDNPPVKEQVVNQGVLDSLVDSLKQEGSDKLVAKVAEVLAIFSADTSSYRKKRASASGLFDLLLLSVQDGQVWRSKAAINSIWAISNLLADAPAVQALALESGLPEVLQKLVQKDVAETIMQPSIFAAGNLAAKHSAGQGALQEAGVLKRLVEIIDEEVKDVKDLASEPFHTEVLEHISELQRQDPAVQKALSEVGGLEELLGIIEEGVQIQPSPPSKNSQLMVIEGQEGQGDELSSIRALVKDLQEEADTEAGILPEVKLPVLTRASSGAKILPKLAAKSRQQIAGDAAWALSLLVAAKPASQNLARDAGVLESLVKLLESAEDSTVAKNALGAISSLVKDNTENKEAVRKANGVQGLVRLLASNPADKEVLKATAQALKFMSSDRPVYERVSRGGIRWLRVLGRYVATGATSLFGAPVSPAAGFAIVISFIISVSACLIMYLIDLWLAHTNLGRRFGRRWNI